jgi:hypothetical protein
MRNAAKRTAACLIAAIAIGGSGCNMIPHDLQPHRLWRFNRNPPPRHEGYFSVSDPIEPASKPEPAVVRPLDESLNRVRLRAKRTHVSFTTARRIKSCPTGTSQLRCRDQGVRSLVQ